MLKIGDMARVSGFSRDTLRYYERLGLVVATERTESGYRLYDDSVASRLEFIQRAKAVGLTLQEIATIFSVRDGGRLACQHIRSLLREKVEGLDTQMRHLERLRGELSVRLAWAEAHPVTGCDGRDVCEYLTDHEVVAAGSPGHG